MLVLLGFGCLIERKGMIDKAMHDKKENDMPKVLERLVEAFAKEGDKIVFTDFSVLFPKKQDSK